MKGLGLAMIAAALPALPPIRPASIVKAASRTGAENKRRSRNRKRNRIARASRRKNRQ